MTVPRTPTLDEPRTNVATSAGRQAVQDLTGPLAAAAIKADLADVPWYVRRIEAEARQAALDEVERVVDRTLVREERRGGALLAERQLAAVLQAIAQLRGSHE